MSSTTEQTSLLQSPTSAKAPEAPVIVQVAKTHGVSPIQQLRESLALRFGPQKLRSKDYYAFGLYDPAMPMAEKRQFAGVTGINALNTALTPPALAPTRAFVGNKLLYTQLLDKLGLATSETQALVSTFREVGQLPVMRDAAKLEAFLRNDALYPLFGKPHHGSLSDGSVRLECIDGHTLSLGNGETRHVSLFADEVLERYPGGYLLQTALDPHPQMAKIAGGAIGCVRVVTVNDGKGPKPVYAVWKLPAPDAMSDNFWQEGSLLALLDLESGAVKTCKRGTGVNAQNFETHPKSGANVIGTEIPYWEETLKLAVQAHGVFPEFGICGFDIAVAPGGPHILECNDNPAHVLYQHASGRGIWNDDFAPIWNSVIERQKKQQARQKSAMRKK